MKLVKEIKISEEIVEESPVILIYDDGQVFLKAYNQGGYDSTFTDLQKLVDYLRNEPELRDLLRF